MKHLVAILVLFYFSESTWTDDVDSSLILDDTTDQSPRIVIHSPKNGQIIPVELHGWQSLVVDVNITISNFHAQEGSLALFVGNGELLLSEQWQPLNGNRLITYEIPFPDKDDHRERLEYLTNGHQIFFRLEFSLLDAGTRHIKCTSYPA